MYRLFLLKFDQHAADKRVLNDLKSEIEAFQPQFYSIQEKKRLLLQLVRVGLGETIWGQILKAPTTDDRLKDAFILIRNMMVRATRVTGKERIPYLRYLDKLFQITQDRRPQETDFYRGLSLFLKAEIQETASNKKKFYFSAGDLLKLSTGDYRFEGMYVQARSYFAAAKHESNANQRNRVHSRAKPIFIKLINEAKSLRSVYYLGEILRIQGNDLAASRCYDVVMNKTKDQVGGAFWYNNAFAAKQNCRSSGDRLELHGIHIDDVVFPERLLVVDREAISLEKFADPDYIRRQYWEEALNLLLKFGLSKRSLYPSAFRLQGSRFSERDFRIVTADIHDRIGAITSGLQLYVVLPQHLQEEVRVSLNGIPLEKDIRGFYQKIPLQLNQLMEICVESDYCYPVVKNHRFTQPGVERMVVSLMQKIVFDSKGSGLDKGVDVFHFPQRLDDNVVFQSVTFPLSQSTFLFRDFQSNIHYRDFFYSDILDGYLVVDSQNENLPFYQSDPMVSKGDELYLVYPDGVGKLMSPEGIAVDSRGNIYITDWGNHKVFVFARDGFFLRSFGDFGYNVPTNIGKTIRLIYPTRIAIAEDTEGVMFNGRKIIRDPLIFIADREGIHLMDANGIYFDTVVPSGMRMGSFYGLTIRGYGIRSRLYVVDRKTGQIERFVARSSESY
jgi:hypothetical protein